MENKHFTHWFEPAIPGVGLRCRILKDLFLGYWIEALDFDGNRFKTFAAKSSVFADIQQN